MKFLFSFLQEKLLLVTQCSSQVDQGAAETGVQGAAGRALRPRLPSPPPPWSPPCLHEGGLVGAGQGVGDLPRPVIRRLVEPKRSQFEQKKLRL